jgi:hypothetical protein
MLRDPLLFFTELRLKVYSRSYSETSVVRLLLLWLGLVQADAHTCRLESSFLPMSHLQGRQEK